MPEQNFSFEDLNAAVDDLATMKYFPRESRASVMDFLSRICPHKRALTWVVAEMLNHVADWPGLAELRGLLCTRFDAADGVDAYCNLPGYTAAEAEAQHYEQHKQLTDAGGYIADPWRELIRIAGGKVRQIGAAK
jgi:hypothetical protein